MADGLLAAHAATGRADDLVLARGLVDRLVADFWDDASGTLFDTSFEHETTVARPRSLVDSATPAANSVAADVLLRLALITGDADYDRRARSILRAVAPVLERQPSMFGRMLCAVDRSLGHPSDAVIAATGRRAAEPARCDRPLRGRSHPISSSRAWSRTRPRRAGQSSRARRPCAGGPPPSSAAATPARCRPAIRSRPPARSSACPGRGFARYAPSRRGTRGALVDADCRRSDRAERDGLPGAELHRSADDRDDDRR